MKPQARTRGPKAPLWRRIAWWQATISILFALPTIISIISFVLLRSHPDYWKEQQKQRTAESIDILTDRGMSLERRVTDEITRVNLLAAPGGDVRTLRVPTADANAWLATRLTPWLENRQITLPPELRDPMVAVRGQSLIIAFAAGPPESAQIVSIELSLSVLEDGRLRVRVEGLRSGRLPVPEFIVRKIASALPASQARAVQTLFQALDGIEIEPRFHLDESRDSKLRSLTFSPEEVTLAFQTLPRPPRQSHRP
jgi:hypothetical protein